MEELMSSVEGSPVRTFLVPEKEQESMPKGAASGGKCSGSFAWYDQNSSLWRTWQLCLTGGWMKYLDHWPKAGIMQNGHALELPMLEHTTNASGCSLWPTPMASWGKGGGNSFRNLEKLKNYISRHQISAQHILQERCIPMGEFGPMHPEFAEWLMGYPTGWTDLEHSETP